MYLCLQFNFPLSNSAKKSPEFCQLPGHSQKSCEDALHDLVQTCGKILKGEIEKRTFDTILEKKQQMSKVLEAASGSLQHSIAEIWRRIQHYEKEVKEFVRQKELMRCLCDHLIHIHVKGECQ